VLAEERPNDVDLQVLYKLRFVDAQHFNTYVILIPLFHYRNCRYFYHINLTFYSISRNVSVRKYDHNIKLLLTHDYVY